MSLHPPVLFIGDRPNPRRNAALNVPFVGCPSYRTLLDWIYRMDVDIRQVDVVNAYTVEGHLALFGDMKSWLRHHKVVTLGNDAYAGLVERLGEDISKAKVFKLPHPSGANRELNDKAEISRLLSRCRNFIYKE